MSNITVCPGVILGETWLLYILWSIVQYTLDYSTVYRYTEDYTFDYSTVYIYTEDYTFDYSTVYIRSTV